MVLLIINDGGDDDGDGRKVSDDDGDDDDVNDDDIDCDDDGYRLGSNYSPTLALFNRKRKQKTRWYTFPGCHTYY